MDSAHSASAIAQIILYAPTVPVTLCVGVRAWKYGPRLARYPAMVFVSARLKGGPLILARQKDTRNTSLLTVIVVLLNIGLVPLIVPFHALPGCVHRLHANFPDHKRKNMFLKVTRFLLLVPVVLLSVAGGIYGNPGWAETQLTLSKTAYCKFTFVLLALLCMATWLYLWCCDPIQDGQVIYVKWLLIAAPILCILAVFGIISVFKAADKTSIWSPALGNAAIVSLMALLPESLVPWIYVYLGHHRFSTADRHGLVAQEGLSRRREQKKKKNDGE